MERHAAAIVELLTQSNDGRYARARAQYRKTRDRIARFRPIDRKLAARAFRGNVRDAVKLLGGNIPPSAQHAAAEALVNMMD